MREAANVLDPHALGGKADSSRRSLSQTTRRHRSLQQPGCDRSMAPAETAGWNRKPDADGKVRPAVVIISRGLPGICEFLVCSIRELHTGFVLSSPTPREG